MGHDAPKARGWGKRITVSTRRFEDEVFEGGDVMVVSMAEGDLWIKKRAGFVRGYGASEWLDFKMEYEDG